MSTKPLSQAQFDLIHELLEKKDLAKLSDERQRRFLSDKANVQRLSKDQATNAIGVLLKCPNLGQTTDSNTRTYLQTEAEKKVVEGRYFIVDPTNGEERFIHVDKPIEGRWAGYTFVKVRASDDLYPVRDYSHRQAILEAIAKDPVTSMNEYGIKLGVCGRCGRTLTNIDSRLRGLGPICAGIIREEYGMHHDPDYITQLLEDDV